MALPLCFKLPFKGKEEAQSLLLRHLFESWLSSNNSFVTNNPKIFSPWQRTWVLDWQKSRSVSWISKLTRIYKTLSTFPRVKMKVFFPGKYLRQLEIMIIMMIMMIIIVVTITVTKYISSPRFSQILIKCFHQNLHILHLVIAFKFL